MAAIPTWPGKASKLKGLSSTANLSINLEGWVCSRGGRCATTKALKFDTTACPVRSGTSAIRPSMRPAMPRARPPGARSSKLSTAQPAQSLSCWKMGGRVNGYYGANTTSGLRARCLSWCLGPLTHIKATENPLLMVVFGSEGNNRRARWP
jgi:hypothetical protein